MSPEQKKQLQAAYDHITESKGWVKKLAEQFHITEQEVLDNVDL
jgi:hypothetical protein